jgi:hypothetical protein
MDAIIIGVVLWVVISVTVLYWSGEIKLRFKKAPIPDGAALIREGRQTYLAYEYEAMELWEDRLDPGRKSAKIVVHPDAVIANPTESYTAYLEQQFRQDLEMYRKGMLHKHPYTGEIGRGIAWVSNDLESQVRPSGRVSPDSYEQIRRKAVNQR